MWGSVTLRLLLASACASAAEGVRSFGRGADQSVCMGRAATLLQHTIDSQTRVGVMDHFWTTGSSEEQQAAAGVELLISYRFDGETIPSISFNPAQMAGQMFGAVQLGNSSTWTDGTRAATGNSSMYAAGDKMGKNALTSAWFNYYKLPFNRSVVVSASVAPRAGATPKPGTCVHLYCILRGHEAPAGAATIFLPSGFALPPRARMELQHTDIVAAPNAFVPLFNVSEGNEGLLFMVTLGLTASPPWGTRNAKGQLLTTNNYVEGCWHLMRNSTEPLPGQVLGTGLEDFFDSAYGFSIIAPGYSPTPANLYPGEGVCEKEGAPYQHPSSGILHFSADYDAKPAAVERFSGYRFFDAEMVGVDDGGQFGWDNGCAGYITWPSINKCGEHPLPPAPPPPFAPPGPPKEVGCADGTCEAFCETTHVHGCGISWDGKQSLRATRTGNCTGGLPKPHCAVPADACADGWEPCLSNDRPEARSKFMQDITAAQCGGSWGAWAAAMSHAPLDTHNSTDREFCPNKTALPSDNGCRGVTPTQWGGESLCCGQECEVPTCQTALWPQSATTCSPAGSGSASCGTLMVKAGSGVCDATVDTNLDGIMCCKTVSTTEQKHEQRTGSGDFESATSHAAADAAETACLTAPTHVRALVWMYTWPK